jgi:hypothetical protein
MTDTPTTEVAVVEPVFSDAERYALAAFLAGYRGLTRDAYSLDLRQFIAWCEGHNLRLFAVRRADIECFAREGHPDVALDMVNSRTFDGRIQLLEYVPTVLAGPPGTDSADP